MATATHADLDIQSLKAVSDQLKLEWTDLAAILGVDQSTLWRWRQGESRPRPLAASRLAQLTELREMLRRLFAGPDLARDWLHTARPEMLGGAETPLAVMRAGRIDRVLTVLHFLARGG
jgi:transcriptional regulator with XRE-family HTH domain